MLTCHLEPLSRLQVPELLTLRYVVILVTYDTLTPASSTGVRASLDIMYNTSPTRGLIAIIPIHRVTRLIGHVFQEFHELFVVRVFLIVFP